MNYEGHGVRLEQDRDSQKGKGEALLAHRSNPGVWPVQSSLQTPPSWDKLRTTVLGTAQAPIDCTHAHLAKMTFCGL